MVNTPFPERLRNQQCIVLAKTADYTMTTDDNMVAADATAAAVTITLPTAASAKNQIKRIKKTDASVNAVFVDANGSETIDGGLGIVLTAQNENAMVVSNGVSWLLLSAPMNQVRLLSRTLVLLTAVAQTNLFTVPTGFTAKIVNVMLEGDTAQSGGTSSKLLIGTTANSYVELLNGSTGHTFISGTATSLLAVGNRMRVRDLYAPATMSVVDDGTFAAGEILKADVSGTVCTAGKVIVEVYGFLL